MPFTPYHMGPAFALKAAAMQRFSLLTYGVAQVAVDLEPLMVLIRGGGELHGWVHSFAAAIPLGAASAVAGKLLTDLLLKVIRKDRSQPPPKLPWRTALLSGWVGTFSHVLIDALIYPDVEPLWPFTRLNPLRFGITPLGMTRFLVISGVLGLLAWLVRLVWQRRPTK